MDRPSRNVVYWILSERVRRPRHGKYASRSRTSAEGVPAVPEPIHRLWRRDAAGPAARPVVSPACRFCGRQV
ncbi:hypothetical protein HMPREF1545_03796 [Oscillibacter sp. KLE 1728]|nr:hypothetical protein HMPREF1545_03796 [Oscillibacter sp. KLE 1728]